MNLRDYYFLLIHGYNGSSKSDWFPAISRLFQSHNVQYRIPDMPKGLFSKYPDGKSWIRIIENEICNTKLPIILVGYSLGARSLLEYIETHELYFPLLLLVASPKNDPNLKFYRFGTAMSFFRHRLDTDKIRSKVSKIIVLSSRDDRIVPYLWGQDLAEELKATFLLYEDKGHMNMPSFAEEVIHIIKNNLA